MTRAVVVAGMFLALGLSGTAEGLDSYQSDVRFELMSVESAAPSDMSLKTVGYRWYFAPVDGMEGPYELQPFRQRASWAEIGYGFGEEDVSGDDGSGLEIAARYAIPETAVGVDLSYLKMETNDAELFHDLRLGAVVWLNDDSNLAIEAGIAFGKLSFVTPMKTTTIDVGARCVMPIEDHHLEISGRFKSISVDAAGSSDLSGIEIETRFFFTKEVFAGFSFSTVDDDTSDESNWEISGGYTFPMGLDVGLSFGEGSAPWAPYPLGDDDVFTIEVGFRF